MRRTPWYSSLTISLFLLLAVSASGEESRTWTDMQDRTITATFVRAGAGSITLRKEDGKEVMVTILSLSPADSTWLRLKGVKTGRNELMEYLLRNEEIGRKLEELNSKVGKAGDDTERAALRNEIDGLLKEREGFQGEAIELFKRYLPVDTPPFNQYKQSFSFAGALTWTLKDEKKKQLGYVSLSYSVKDDWNKKLKNGGKNTEQLGIPSRGTWFFFSDNVLLQITLDNDTLKKDGAVDAFMNKADIKGLYSLGMWK